MRIVQIFVAAAIPFVLLGCPDKASPDPAAAAGKDGGGGAAATTAPAASAPAAAKAAPAKNGEGW
jgi:hypothetical protein